MQTITLEYDAGVAFITLNRPKVMNALSSLLRTELREALTQAEQNARTIVLSGGAPGKGAAFCSGQDLADGAALSSGTVESVLREEYEPLLKQIMACPLPVIAAVNGTAAGAGANLALACDVVIAAQSARFIQAFTRIGLIPDAGGTYWLPRQIGFARAMGAMLFADSLSADQAAHWGMIYESVPDEGFTAHVKKRASALASGPSLALRNVKRALRASMHNDFDAQIALEARLQGECGQSADFKEGIAAFMQKRPPRFEGR